MAFTSITQDLRNLLGETRTSFNDGELFADVTINERPTFKSTVTKKRTESGSDMTDLVKADPVVLDMSIIFADDLFGASAQDKADILESYWRDSLPIPVLTEFKQYESMVISQYSVDRSADTSNGVFVSITLEEIQIRSTSTIQINAGAGLTDTLTPSVNQGFKATSPASADSSSILFNLFG